MNPMYQYQKRITYYDLDYRGKIKLSALLRMVHEAADVNAKELGAGFNVLSPLGMTFVIQRFGVKSTRMPVYDENVVIRTWPSDVSKGTFLRRGDMYDQDGNKIMEWASLWLLFDINERKVLRPSALPTPLSTLGDEGVGVMPIKIAIPQDDISCGQQFSYYSHQASYRDADTNMHMNNSIYGDLVGNAIFPVETDAAIPHPDWSEVQINYLAEIRLGETVDVTALRDRDCFTVIGKSGGRTAFISRVS